MTTTVQNWQALHDLDPSALTDKSALVLGFYEPGDGGGGTFTWDASSSLHDIGVHVRSTHAATGAWTRVYSGAINVLWFGVVSGDFSGATPPSNIQGRNRERIQGAIDYATAGPANNPHYNKFARLYFPQSSNKDASGQLESYYEVDGPIVLPRGVPTGLFLYGDGADESFIVGTGDFAVFRPETLAENPNPEATGWYRFEDLRILTRGTGPQEPTQVDGWEHCPRCFWWDIRPTDKIPNVRTAPRLEFHRCAFDGGFWPQNPSKASRSLVRIWQGDHGSCLRDCVFDRLASGDVGLDGAMHGSLINVRNGSKGGGLVRLTEGVASLTMMYCRNEGATGIPAYDFRGVGNLTMIGCYTEGTAELPALFHFKTCSNVTIVNPGVATPDKDKKGDIPESHGILFENCIGCRVTNVQATASFGQLNKPGGFQRRTILVKDCMDVRIDGGITLTNATSPQATAFMVQTLAEDISQDIQFVSSPTCYASWLTTKGLQAFGQLATGVLEIANFAEGAAHETPLGEGMTALFVEGGQLKFRRGDGVHIVQLSPVTP